MQRNTISDKYVSAHDSQEIKDGCTTRFWCCRDKKREQNSRPSHLVQSSISSKDISVFIPWSPDTRRSSLFQSVVGLSNKSTNCREHDVRKLWAYLSENWYQADWWGLWARNAHPEIPRLKTTTMEGSSRSQHLSSKASISWSTWTYYLEFS